MTTSTTELVKAVRELAAAYPDATYDMANSGNGCYYDQGTVTNGPTACGCIIGQGMRICKWYHKMFDLMAGTAISEAKFDHCVREELRWLERVQQAQDRGETWSKAVLNAD